MAHNRQEDKHPRSGGPQAHPSNETPKHAGGERGAGDVVRGGNKVGRGEGSDTGNKGKNR